MAELDGNSLAGTLAELFTIDVTAASARCAACFTTAAVGDMRVTSTPAGSIGRCSHCDALLITVVRTPDRTWLGMPGVTALEIRL